MSATQWLLVGAVAVCGFWMVGAHNRIVGLRGAIAQAWAQVDSLLSQRAATLGTLVHTLWERWPAGRAAMDALVAAQHQLQVAAQAVRSRPARAATMATLSSAEAALTATLARLLNQVEAEPALPTDDEVATQMLVLFELGPQLIEARLRFNQASSVYNDAITRFPTKLLVPVFRFESAGTI